MWICTRRCGGTFVVLPIGAVMVMLAVFKESEMLLSLNQDGVPSKQLLHNVFQLLSRNISSMSFDMFVPLKIVTVQLVEEDTGEHGENNVIGNSSGRPFQLFVPPSLRNESAFELQTIPASTTATTTRSKPTRSGWLPRDGIPGAKAGAKLGDHPGNLESARTTVVDDRDDIGAGNWTTISHEAACQSNEHGIQPIQQMGRGYTLKTCKAACASTHDCVAVDFFSRTSWCNLYDEACGIPLMHRDGASSHKLKGTSTSGNAASTWVTISEDAACESSTEVAASAIKSMKGFSLETCKLTCGVTRGCTAIDFFASTSWCSLFYEACTRPSWKQHKASSHKLKDTGGIFEVVWTVISPDAACEGNKEGIVPRPLGKGYHLETCKAACASTVGCVAIDFYANTTWCNLFDRACARPLRRRDSSSSHRMKAHDRPRAMAPLVGKNAKAPPCSQVGLYYPGPDVAARQTASDADACQKLCAQTEGCEAFVWFASDNHGCHLRERASQPIMRAGTVSGPPSCNSCLEVNTMYPAPDVPGAKRTVEASWAACQIRCAKTRGCAVFSYFNTGGGCLLRARRLDPSQAFGVTSGPPSCQKRFPIYEPEFPDLPEENGTVSQMMEERLNYSLSVFPSRKLPKRALAFNRCALVGSSGNLRGRRLGSTIDAHDTIIRVNKLPTANYFEDFGQKTHVYFTNPFFLKGRSCKSYPVQYMGATSKSCNLLLPGKCNKEFVAMVWKGADEPYRHKGDHSWEKQFSVGCSVVCETVACAVQNDKLNRAAYRLLQLGGHEPTTGFHAFLTFVPICNSLRLYGFGGGWTTADNHTMLKSHGYQTEWAFWDRIGRGKLNADNAPSGLKAAFKRLVKTRGLTVVQ